MGYLDDLRALADALPAEVKPVAAEVGDVVGAIVHTLKEAGVNVPTPVADVAQVAENLVPEEDATVGSAVFDVAGTATDEPASSPPPPEDDLEARIRAKSDELQSLQVQLADRQKTQHATGETV